MNYENLAEHQMKRIILDIKKEIQHRYGNRTELIEDADLRRLVEN